MTANRKSERDFVVASLGALDRLIAKTTDEDVLTRRGLETRRRELTTQLESLEEAAAVPTVSTGLFFSGAPVIGSEGIESEFAGNALTKYQDLISKLVAQDAGILGQRGVVPRKAAARLHVTNMPRGSIGFLLEELEPQGELIHTALSTAIAKASDIMNAFGDIDDARFRDVVESLDQRVLATTRDFFELMDSQRATFRLVTDEHDRHFGPPAIARAVARAHATTVEETVEHLPGQLAGVLPEAHQFEFRTGGRTIRGRVDRNLPPSVLANYNLSLVNTDAIAEVRVKRVRTGGEVVQEGFTLLRLLPPTGILGHDEE